MKVEFSNLLTWRIKNSKERWMIQRTTLVILHAPSLVVKLLLPHLIDLHGCKERRHGDIWVWKLCAEPDVQIGRCKKHAPSEKQYAYHPSPKAASYRRRKRDKGGECEQHGISAKPMHVRARVCICVCVFACVRARAVPAAVQQQLCYRQS
eukprot:1159664-Pelagomonas_calceolata.AAC.11